MACVRVFVCVVRGCACECVVRPSMEWELPIALPPSVRAIIPPEVSPCVLLWSMVVVVDCLFRIDVDDYLKFDI